MHNIVSGDDFLDENVCLPRRFPRYVEAALYPCETWPRDVKDRVALSDRAALIIVAQRYVADGDSKGFTGVSPAAFDAETLTWALQVSDACLVVTQDLDQSFPFAWFTTEFRDAPIVAYVATREDFRPLWMKVARNLIGYRAFDIPPLPYEGVRQ